MFGLHSKMLRDFYKTTPMREGILNWYPFEKNAAVLERSDGALTALLHKRCAEVEIFNDKYGGGRKFDYLVVVDPGAITVDLLRRYYSYLNANGRLLLAFENPCGLQYFAGKRNPRTDQPYMFLCGESKTKVANSLTQAGFLGQKWYYPFTNHYFAREIYSQNYLPNEFLGHRGAFFMEDDYTKEFDERGLWKEIISGGAFEFMCNSYLVEARVSGRDKECVVDFAAITAYREHDKAFITTVNNNGTAQKRACFPEGKARLQILCDNHRELEGYGIKTLPLELEGEYLNMERLNLPTLWDFWAAKIQTGELRSEHLIYQYDKIRDAILKSSKNGKLFWELVPANCFYDEKKDELIFFDQEFYWENVNPDIGIVRALYAMKYSSAFLEFPETNKCMETLKERYGLSERWNELVEYADSKTVDYVFNNAHTRPLKQMAERAVERARERVAERVEQRRVERETAHERYKNMCAAAVALKARFFSHPAIYGYGIHGKMLRFVLESADMDIACIIDRGMPVVRGVPLFSCVEEISDDIEPDVIIVTPVKDAGNIAKGLAAKAKCQIITLGELTYD